jgi:hypothetical protein
MTTQPPPIEFKVRADARQAQEAIDGLNKKFKEGETASSMLDKRIEALTKDLDHLSTAIVSGKGNTEAYRAEMQRLERQLDALHGVTPQVSSSVKTMATSMDTAQKSTRNVGQAALEVSRGLEDLQYGVGGVVNNIPSMVMALGGTAGLTAAISLGAVAVNQLVKNFGGVDEAAKVAASAAKKHMSDLRDEIADLADDLRAMQVGAERAKMEKQGEVVGAAADAARAALNATGLSAESVQRLKDRTDLPAVMQENVKKANEAIALLDAEIAKLAGMRRIQEEKDAQASIDRAVDVANAQTAAEERRRKSQEKLADKAAKREDDEWEKQQEREKQANERAMLKANTEQLERAGMRALGIDGPEFRAQLAAIDAAEEADRAHKKAMEDAAKLHASRLKQLRSGDWADRLALSRHFTDQELENLNRLSDDEWKILQARQDSWSSFYEGMVSNAQGAFSVVANASSQALDGIITGQEHALETAALGVFKQAGTFVIGEGVKVGAAGVANLLIGNPIGAAQVAGGLALAGLGVSMGGVATGALHVLNGGTLGQKLPDDKASRTDRGASPSSGGGSSSGGPLVVNISYGVGGPLPEDTAREVRKVLDVDSRR